MEEVKVSVESKSEVERSISIEIPRSMYNERFERAVRKAAQQAKIKGFRPGRAPAAVIQKMYGPQIHQDVLGELVSSAYHDAVQTHELKVVGYPDINIDGEAESEGNFVVTAGVSVFPEPKISNYMGLQFSVAVEPYKQSMFDDQVTRMREAYADLVAVEDRQIAAEGDTVQVDYRGTVEGAEFPGSSAQGSYVKIGSNTLQASLETGMIGQKVGEEREIFVNLAEGEENAEEGKTALYVVKLLGIFDRKLPALDNDFAQKTKLGETIEEFNTKLEELLKNDLERRNKTAKEEQFFKTLLEQNQFEVPQAMCDEEIRNFLYEMGLLDANNKQSRQFDVTAFRETLGEAATFRVKQAVALNSIIEAEGAIAEKEDVEKWLDERSAEEGRPREDIDRMYGFPKNLARLQRMVTREQMLDKLVKSASITEEAKGAESESEAAPKKAKGKKAKSE